MLTNGVLTSDDLAQMGWELKPEGLCQADRCVPLPADVDRSALPAALVAERLGMPILTDETSGMSAIGPESGQAALTSNQLPELTLADFDGNPFNLTQMHGRKSLLMAWASW